MNSIFDSIRQKEEQLLCKTYARYPIAVAQGRGSRLWDCDGKEYVDMLSGIAVTALGHCNEELAETIALQARKLIHVSNLFYQEEQLALAKRLLNTAHFNKAFFCNSGAEANEAAIKLARRYQQRVRNKNAYEILTFEGCFHGRTLATLAATGQSRFQDGFAPMPDGFRQIPWNDAAALKSSITDKTAAVLVEMIQGEGGIRPVSRPFAQELASVCREKNILFMVDEVQTGLGRTGQWWSFQHFGVQPDVITIAKALANGLPMGAMLTTDAVAKAFVAGSHATTYGAGALISAVAEKTLAIIERDNLLERADIIGKQAMECFRDISQRHPGTITEVRGMGLMIGIQLSFPGKKIWEALLEKGFILNLTQEKILRLLPALTISQKDIESFAAALEEILATQA